MRLPVKTLKHSIEYGPSKDVEYAVAASKNRAGYFAEYEGADFVLTVGLIPEDRNIYLRLENPDQSYKVLTGPLAVFAAMLVEHHTKKED